IARRSGARRAQVALYWCIGLCVLEFAVADPLHPGYFLHAPGPRDARLDRFLSALPPGISVATQEEAYTHLAATNPNATLLPEGSQNSVRACYLLTDTDFPDSVRLNESRLLVGMLTSTGTYITARRDGGVTLYKSRLCRAAGPRARPTR